MKAVVAGATLYFTGGYHCRGIYVATIILHPLLRTNALDARMRISLPGSIVHS